MAETRKYQTSASGLAAAVRAAIGDDVRPNEPGADASVPAEAQAPAAPTTSAWFLTSGAERFLVPNTDATESLQ